VRWPAYADAVLLQATYALPYLTVTDNGWGGSRVAQAMYSNTKTLYYSKYGVFPDADISDQILSQSISDFVTSVFENLLTFIGAYRKEGHNSTQLAAAEVTVPGVVFGHAGFGYTVFIMTMSVTLACAYFIIAKRAWNHVVELDFTDVSDVALNTSKGGTALFDYYEKNGCLSETYITRLQNGRVWLLRRMRIRLYERFDTNATSI
jgi:hypothetical protein